MYFKETFKYMYAVQEKYEMFDYRNYISVSKSLAVKSHFFPIYTGKYKHN